MTTEFVLLIGVYAFIVIGVFLGDSGPVSTFRDSAPRFAAKLERNIAVGQGFRREANRGNPADADWRGPENQQGGGN